MRHIKRSFFIKNVDEAFASVGSRLGVRWAVEMGYIITADTLRWITVSNNIELISWMCDNDLTIKLAASRIIKLNAQTLRAFVRIGNLNGVKWVLINDPFLYHLSIIMMAISFGYLNILIWIRTCTDCENVLFNDSWQYTNQMTINIITH
jgi:hypothetical protein